MESATVKPEQKLIIAPAPSSALTPVADPAKSSLIMARDPDRYVGIASKPFAKDAATVLMAAIESTDVEIRPDGIVFLPEIKYRRRLNTAFGPGGWALMPRGDATMIDNTMTREYGLYVEGRYVSEARGECDYIPENKEMSYASVAEGVKSNALMRCCKDIGVASELWDPGYIAAWKAQHAVQVCRKNSKSQKPQWRRKDREPFYDETGTVKAQARQEEPAQEERRPEPSKPAQATAPAAAATNGKLIWRGIITAVNLKEKASADKKRDAIQIIGDGFEARGWIATGADSERLSAARELKDQAYPALITYTKNASGYNDLVAVEPDNSAPDAGANG
jgi:hypothetical protein